MQIELKFAELHSPLFLAGKNFGLKLDHGKHRGIGLIYDRAEKELLVTWDGHEAIVPLTNVASMTPGAAPIAAVVKTVATGKPIVAQVASPMSHVHGGPGAGKTR